jgi:hypothetical protein
MRSLDLTGISRADMVDALLDSPVVDSLEALDLRHASFTEASLKRFLARSKLRRAAEMPAIDWSSNDAIMAAFPGLQLRSREGW